MADPLDGIEDYPEQMLCPRCAIAEAGRTLASVREELIVRGHDPKTLAEPFNAAHPAGTDLFTHPRWGLVSCDCTCHPANADADLEHVALDPGDGE